MDLIDREAAETRAENETRAEEDTSEDIQRGISKQLKQCMYWFFTINNPQQTTPEELIKVLKDRFDNYSGSCFQKEKGEEETIHWQGVLALSQKMRWTACKNKFAAKDIKGWVEPVKKLDAALKYVTKEDTRIHEPTYDGSITKDGIQGKQQGKRKDLEQAYAIIKKHKSLVELAEQMPEIIFKYPAGCKLHLQLVPKQERTWTTIAVFIWGEPGTGKTPFAEELFSGDKYFQPPIPYSQNAWFDGYNGEEYILLDEMDVKEHYGIATLKKLTDRGRLQLPIKGGHVTVAPKVVIITSQTHWRDWYADEIKKCPANERALEKRFETNGLTFHTSAGHTCRDIGYDYVRNEIKDKWKKINEQETHSAAPAEIPRTFSPSDFINQPSSSTPLPLWADSNEL